MELQKLQYQIAELFRPTNQAHDTIVVLDTTADALIGVPLAGLSIDQYYQPQTYPLTPGEWLVREHRTPEPKELCPLVQRLDKWIVQATEGDHPSVTLGEFFGMQNVSERLAQACRATRPLETTDDPVDKLLELLALALLSGTLRR